MQKYLDKLISYFNDIYNDRLRDITIDTEIEEVSLSVDTVIQCGLIIHELISNSFKHAFPDKRPGKINLSLKHHNKHAELTVSDNGIGIPPEIDIENTQTLGMQLIQNLLRQLNGTMVVEAKNGTKIKLTLTP